MKVRKRIVMDEAQRPVAVQIDYGDWMEIERQLDLERPAEEPSEEMLPSGRTAGADSREQGDGFGALLEDSRGIWERVEGLEYQRRIREEWTRPWDPKA
ncbi:hypothetical protein [Salisaeta longa]|uniref:hypothetical protein n=1 Tax=Salisaeta longa TaxID=503170 RepID=UPI0012FA4F7F|nr:hypothetical protein [Salisaeta longa]